mmetsp:Transcript_13897/g.39997  ORF Transcript_13897/g.39997 Transcript_13897/m.39997 type:complete len:307 (+) Transcript_13897:771-1691(+)
MCGGAVCGAEGQQAVCELVHGVGEEEVEVAQRVGCDPNLDGIEGGYSARQLAQHALKHQLVGGVSAHEWSRVGGLPQDVAQHTHVMVVERLVAMQQSRQQPCERRVFQVAPIALIIFYVHLHGRWRAVIGRWCELQQGPRVAQDDTRRQVAERPVGACLDGRAEQTNELLMLDIELRVRLQQLHVQCQIQLLLLMSLSIRRCQLLAHVVANLCEDLPSTRQPAVRRAGSGGEGKGHLWQRADGQTTTLHQGTDYVDPAFLHEWLWRLVAPPLRQPCAQEGFVVLVVRLQPLMRVGGEGQIFHNCPP